MLSLAALGILLFMILVTTAENLHSRMLELGVSIWPDYTFLRDESVLPACNADINVEARLQQLEAEFAQTQSADDLLTEEFDREATRQSLLGRQVMCQELRRRAEASHARITPWVEAYRTADFAVAELANLALTTQRIILALLIFATAVITTQRRHHIAFRPIESQLDHRLSTSLQLVANTALAWSAWRFREQTYASGVAVNHPEIIYILLAEFIVLSVISLTQLLKPPRQLTPGGTWTHAFLSVPLYVYMVLAGLYYFTFETQHIAGLSLHFAALFELAGMFIQIALFLWVGMLLKQTRLGERVFALFTPWNLPPELLCVLAILVMAVPTAYTGGSGIIVLALGLVVYEELRRVGTRRQFALATTALSGSAGIVLNPCILIMLVAMLNKEVVSSELYDEGFKVFLITVSLFFFYALLTKQEKLRLTPPRTALGPMLQASRPLLNYAVVIALVVLAYGLLLDAWVDEFTAAIILPVVIIAVLVFDRTLDADAHQFATQTERAPTVGGALATSIDGAAVHIGALLIFIGANMVLGGVIQRSGGNFEFLTATFDSRITCMLFMLVCLILLGMFMESMSGVVLVSATLTKIAYASGIHPVHFWMTTLVALELGFLTPPVALNHLYTRQVVGEREHALAQQEGHNFWYRHERLLLPIAVMGSALLLVAFGPFVTGYNGWYP